MTRTLCRTLTPLILSAALAAGPAVLSGGVVLATVGASEAQAEPGSRLLRQVMRDLKKAQKDFNKKMKVKKKVRRKSVTARRSGNGRAAAGGGASGGTIYRSTGLVDTSIRPEARPGILLASTAAGAPLAAAAAPGGEVSGPRSEAELRQELALRAAVEAGDLAPEIAQVIRGGSFPTIAQLQNRTTDLGEPHLSGEAEFTLAAARVSCNDAGSGLCAEIETAPEHAALRADIEEIEAQAVAVRRVAALPEVAAAMAALREERGGMAEVGAAQRDYPVERGEELPAIDTLLESRLDD